MIGRYFLKYNTRSTYRGHFIFQICFKTCTIDQWHPSPLGK